MGFKERLSKIWGRKWNRRFIIITAIILVLCIPMRCGGPYKGRVIDRETGRPIVGVVAVATWSTVSFNIAGGTTRSLGAKETIADEKGEFEIKGKRGMVFGLFTGNVRIHIFKLGYKPVECFWNSFENPGFCFQEGGRFKCGIAIFPLAKVAKNRLDTEGRPPLRGSGEKNAKHLPGYFEEVLRWEKAIGLKN